MEKHLIHSQIATLLETIIEQQELITSHENNIPQIELDLVLSNVRKLYDLYRSLEKIEGKSIPPKKTIRRQQRPVMPGLFEDEYTQNNLNTEVNREYTEDQIIEPIAEPNDASKTFFHKEEDHSIQEVPTVVIEKTAAEAPSLESNENPVITPSDSKETLHDKILMTNHDEEILVNKLKKQPIADLRTAIGINEKFLFINEIFNADAVAYSESIDFINQSKSIAEARVYVNTILKPRFNWTLDNKRVTDFIELVERRFL